uniref:Protein RED C-terminal domain-containing protein n=1 Tax=Petromyzon marinus TaxID=7757 RepID=S4RKV7_PETMA
VDEKKLPEADLTIFDDVGEYVTTAAKPGGREREREREKEREREREKKREREREREKEREREREKKEREIENERKAVARASYFEKPSQDEEPSTSEKVILPAKELIQSINEKFAGSTWAPTAGNKRHDSGRTGGDFLGTSNSYAECYPNSLMEDVGVDSDDEVDYSKMDQGNKKGPLGRWDFETQEEYSDYMSNKEALPKAAFQYGIKMAEGRKTRRHKEGNEKAELDRQWKKISAIIEKRKNMAADGVDVKRPKY